MTPTDLQEDLHMLTHTSGGCCARRLAILDSSPTPSGETVVAEHEGAPLRAWSAQFQVAA